jgi:hypothetical protein
MPCRLVEACRRFRQSTAPPFSFINYIGTSTAGCTASCYWGCFTTLGHNCRRWFPRSLWWKMFIKTCVRFWTVTELRPFCNSCTRPRVNFTEPAGGHVLSLVAYFCQLQTAQFLLSRNTGCRAFHNRAAVCGRRWHFRKPALSTDKFELKVISRS